MSYNGSGTFVINTAGQPVVSGTVISSTAFNALTADLATGLSTAITKDGQTTPTANIPMGNNKITGLAVGTAATDAANLSQVQSTTAKLIDSVSGADTITGTLSPTLTAYAAGQMFYFVAAGDNTGAVTLNINSLGAKSVTRDGAVALAAGDIKSGEVVVVVYDGTQFQVVSQLNSSGDARFANVSIASALNVGGVATVTGGSVLNGGVVINEPGADVDFRVESDTDANCLFVDASANAVGIGTSSPAAKLEAYRGSIGEVARFTASADGARSLKFISSDNTGSGAVWTRDIDSAYAQHRWAKSGTTLLMLNEDGNLGLGVTPSAWNSTSKAIQISAYSSVSQQANGAANFGFNFYEDAVNTFKYISTDEACRFSALITGGFGWFTAPSGTAGNAITFTQAMTLDASGNLGVGTTSPSGKISVVETAGGAPAIRIQGDSSTNVGRLSFTDNGVTRTNALLTADNSGNLAFATDGTTERARITAAGELLVGTTGVAASERLAVKGAGNTSATYICQFVNSDGSLVFNFENAGRFRTGTLADSPYNYVVGGTNRDLYVDSSGYFGYVSSVRASKTNIAPVSDTDWLLQLNPVTFNFRKKDADGNYTDEADGPVKHGLIAEEVEAVNSDLCFYDDEDKGGALRGVNYSHLITPMLKLIQKQQAAIAALEAKVAALEAK